MSILNLEKSGEISKKLSFSTFLIIQMLLIFRTSETDSSIVNFSLALVLEPDYHNSEYQLGFGSSAAHGIQGVSG